MKWPSRIFQQPYYAAKSTVLVHRLDFFYILVDQLNICNWNQLGLESQATLSTNDIVINKLTQILSYLRQGGKHGKKIKKTKDKEMPPPQIIPGLKVHKSSDDSIYGNIGTYQPTSKDKTNDSGSKERRSDKRFYFDDKTRKDKDEAGTDKERSKDAKSDTVLEAERTLGALLKPGAADQMTKVSSVPSKTW